MKIIECPRDAMQGLTQFIPTEVKIRYNNVLLQAGFDTLDCGSFVSPKAIPQMADTAEVLEGLDLDGSKTKLLVIIANVRGALQAVDHKKVTYLGYPFSISETFQQRNTHSTIKESLVRVEDIQQICEQKDKELVVYLSMAFGNPYGDAWNLEIVEEWIYNLANAGITTISLSDTIGVSTPENISYLFQELIPRYPEIEFGAHLHTHSHNWEEKVRAVIESGCKRLDTAMKGFGGCPMAKDELVGNMPTENVYAYLQENSISNTIKSDIFHKALQMADSIFPK
ncbi:MAG TPA: hydroxymethylglutaryl-CoA lyase [Saprospiraceae bacterium]|nr:hydroxymethylglutaryl-CoA lyase [Saprospiraceae bacterium]HQW56203.1 hydroxymethylglutaryl-CoA lyase [Saprospiraceae bacterium]